MENASKALIIAGSILLSILIIGLGMAIFSGASSTDGREELDQYERSVYNSKFENYAGPKVSGSKLKSLYGVVAQHNQQNSEDKSKVIKLTKVGDEGPGFDGTIEDTSAINTAKGKIQANYNYNVELVYNDASLVSEIKITRVKSSTK